MSKHSKQDWTVRIQVIDPTDIIVQVTSRRSNEVAAEHRFDSMDDATAMARDLNRRLETGASIVISE